MRRQNVRYLDSALLCPRKDLVWLHRVDGGLRGVRELSRNPADGAASDRLLRRRVDEQIRIVIGEDRNDLDMSSVRRHGENGSTSGRQLLPMASDSPGGTRTYDIQGTHGLDVWKRQLERDIAGAGDDDDADLRAEYERRLREKEQGVRRSRKGGPLGSE